MSEKLVGPVLSDRELYEAVIEAAEQDNPGVRLITEDRGGYMRVQAPRRLRLTQSSLEEALGRPFKLSELEPALSSFGGRIQFVGDDEVVFYLDRED